MIPFIMLYEVALKFWVQGRNPKVWPFKWKLSSSSFLWRYLFLASFFNFVGAFRVKNGPVMIRSEVKHWANSTWRRRAKLTFKREIKSLLISIEKKKNSWLNAMRARDWLERIKVDGHQTKARSCTEHWKRPSDICVLLSKWAIR